jgi:hypothetical protein
MASPAQAAANLANAQLSTGPRTQEGKQRSAQNSLKHGLNARRPLIPGEDPAEFERLRRDVYTRFAPQGELEEMLADDLAGIQWRLRRIDSLESDIHATADPDFSKLRYLSIHASRLRRSFTDMLKDLLLLQKQRDNDQDRIIKEQLSDAILIREADLAAGRTTDFDSIGFVLNLEFVDEQIRRKNALRAAAVTRNDPQNTRRAA